MEDYRNYYYEVPSGWKALAVEAVQKIAESAQRQGIYEELEIFQIKEKYGSLCIYVNKHNDEINNIIQIYSKRSENTCAECGSNATMMSTMWICPHCMNCVKEHNISAVTREEFDRLMDERQKRFEEALNGNS